MGMSNKAYIRPLSLAMEMYVTYITPYTVSMFSFHIPVSLNNVFFVHNDKLPLAQNVYTHVGHNKHCLLQGHTHVNNSPLRKSCLLRYTSTTALLSSGSCMSLWSSCLQSWNRASSVLSTTQIRARVSLKYRLHRGLLLSFPETSCIVYSKYCFPILRKWCVAIYIVKLYMYVWCNYTKGEVYYYSTF